MSQRAIQAFASLLPEQAQALSALSNSSVEFIIVGGYAMRYHGSLRRTNDLDIVVKQTQDNVSRITSALAMLSTGRTSSTAAQHLLQPEKKLVWHSVDIFSNMPGLAYPELEAQAEQCQFGGMSVSILSVPHMRIAKRLALAAPERREKWSIDEADLLFLEY